MIYSPMLSKKGDGNIAGSISASGSGLLNLQSSYAVGNNVGIMADGMYHYRDSKTNSNYDSQHEITEIISGEAGIGYFSKPDDEKSFLVQLYSGAGAGKTKNKITAASTQDPEVSTRFMNVFVQPGFGWKRESIEMGVDFRANFIRLYDLNAYLFEDFEWWNTEYQFTQDSTLQFVLLEPTFTLKAGSKKLKGVIQTGFTFPIINNDDYFAVNSFSDFLGPIFKFSMGVSFSFGKK